MKAIEIYRSNDGDIQLTVNLENDTVWLSAKQMSVLFEREDSNIRRHIINVFKEGELEKKATCIFCTFLIQINLYLFIVLT